MPDAGGRLTSQGRQQVMALADALVHARVAAVYSSPRSSAVESAELAAHRLGVVAHPVEGLEDIRAGETNAQLIDRMAEALRGIADLHRGETVLVFGHEGAICVAVPALADNLVDDHASHRPLSNADPVTVEIGDDGWRVTAWPAGPQDATNE